MTKYIGRYFEDWDQVERADEIKKTVISRLFATAFYTPTDHSLIFSTFSRAVAWYFRTKAWKSLKYSKNDS